MTGRACLLLLAFSALGRANVCHVLKNKELYQGRRAVVEGVLLQAAGIAFLEADVTCDAPTLIRKLRRLPDALAVQTSAIAGPDVRQRLANAGRDANVLRKNGHPVRVFAMLYGQIVFTGESAGTAPAILRVERVDDIRMETLPDAAELPVIPICKLFEDLSSWKSKRIAVLAYAESCPECTYIWGRGCEGNFITQGYRWPVRLSITGPPNYPEDIASVAGLPDWGTKVKRPRAARVYVGRLRTQEDYVTIDDHFQQPFRGGFGHLNLAAAELVVEVVLEEP